MITQQEAQQLVRQHGSERKAATASGIPRSTLRKILLGGTVKARAGNATAPLEGKSPVRSLKEFRGLYDLETIVPQHVNEALKKLGSGWLYEMEFAKLAGVTTTQLSTFRDRYADHVVVVRDRRRAWAGRKEVADEMRRML